MKVLYKVIEASEEKFKAEPMCDIEVTEYACSKPVLIQPSRIKSFYFRMKINNRSIIRIRRLLRL